MKKLLVGVNEMRARTKYLGCRGVKIMDIPYKKDAHQPVPWRRSECWAMS
jgi:hypothetical protein